jgi:putative spermidine/putrescine transport system ATP-binding protein
VKAVQFNNISRHFGAMRAVDDVNFSIEHGEFFSMLGPSGSGKTTCLRLIAGFDQPGAGTLLIGGKDMAGVPPYLRDINTVFQDYALFPHMNVRDNVAYSLMVRGIDKAPRWKRADAMLDLVRLGELGDRAPAALSGGQRQRVSLARALINEPKILLLDEPLGALDLKLREQMQFELKALQRKLGITFIYVTHDQGEALSMSDRVVVFNKGRIEQIATPRQIYQEPATLFVAEFVGTSNLLQGPFWQSVLGRVPAAIRPESIRLGQVRPDDVILDGSLTDLQFLGSHSRAMVTLAGGETLVTMISHDHDGAGALYEIGAPIRLAFAPTALRFLAPGAGR